MSTVARGCCRLTLRPMCPMYIGVAGVCFSGPHLRRVRPWTNLKAGTGAPFLPSFKSPGRLSSLNHLFSILLQRLDGKSTLAGQLKSNSSQWAYINQDSLGDRQRCEEACRAELWAGRDVLIDRCNHTRRQREVWLSLARDYMRRSGRPLQLLCLALELPVEECKRRAAARTGHATLAAADAPAVIDRFLSEYELPAPSEGFHEVHRLTSPEQVHQVLHTRLLPLHGPYLAPAQQQQQQLNAAAPAWHPANGHSYYSQPPKPAGWGAAGPAVLAPAWQGQQLAWGSGAGGGGWGAATAGQGMPSAQLWGPSPWQQQRQHGYATLAHPPGLKLPDHEARDQRDQQPDTQQGRGEAANEAVPQQGQQQQQQQQREWDRERWRPRSRSPHKRPSSTLPLPRGPTSPTAAQLPSSNIVPFGKGSGAAAAAPGSPAAKRPRFLDDIDDARPILLFDMNGTLTSHTHQRRSTGRNLARPGAHHLRRLASKFRVGVFTSASKRTVSVAVDLLEREAGSGPPVFDRRLILHRVHTEPVPEEHIATGGNHWDTVKPLHCHFGKLHRVLLLDDDEYKALPAEKGNLVHVPCWQNEDPQDGMVRHIVEVLLQVFGSLERDADVRVHTSTATKLLKDLSERMAAERAAQQGTGAEGATSAWNAEEIEIDMAVEAEEVEGEDGAGEPSGRQQVLEAPAPKHSPIGEGQQGGGPNPEEIEITNEEDQLA